MTAHSYEVWYEGGPLDGKRLVVPELTPILRVVTPHAERGTAEGEIYGLAEVGAAPGGVGEAEAFEVETSCYYRERAEHRSQVVTYFWTEAARDAAFLEDTRGDE